MSNAWPISLTQEDFFKVFPIQVCVRQVTSWMEPFLPQGNNLNNLGKGPLAEAAYPISKVYAV